MADEVDKIEVPTVTLPDVPETEPQIEIQAGPVSEPVPVDEPTPTLTPEEPEIQTQTIPITIAPAEETAPADTPTDVESDKQIETPPPQTAQFPPNEPLPPVVSQTPINPIRAFLGKARVAIQGRKRKKLDKVMGLFEKHPSITNDQVEKLLHVSDATATRYLSILEKEGKIKQTGRTGKGVSYTKL